MKNEKMLEMCLGMAQYLSKEDRALFDRYQKHPEIEGVELPGILSYMVRTLKEDIAAESCKASGRSDALKAAKRIIESAKNFQTRRATHGAWVESEKQCLCDGYQGVRLVTPLPVESIPEDVEPFGLGSVIENAKRNAGSELSLPTIGELKAHIKIDKAAKKVERDRSHDKFDFGEKLPMVDAEYLLNLLELLPGCKAFAARSRADVSAIYFEAEAGDGVLMPVRRK